MNEMSDEHLSIETLADYVDGRLAAEAGARVEAHVAGCEACRTEADWLRAALRRESWTAPPPALSASVRAAFRRQSAPTASPPGWLDRLRAALLPRAGWAMAAAALVVLIVGAVAWQTWRTTEVTQTAQLSSVTGTVEVLRASQAQWQPVAAGIILQSGDRLRTAANASATLTYFEGSQTQLQAETEISLIRLAARPDGATQSIVLRQTIGATLHRVQPLPNVEARFEVDTEAAVIAVRGTTFQVRAASDGVTRVTVAEGVVEVLAVQSGVLARLTAGQSLTVPEPAGATVTVTPSPTGTSVQPTPAGIPSRTTVTAPNPTQPIAPTAPPITDGPPPTPTEDDDDGGGDD
jgi:predicted anti-sigma-YlaC factor YlaD